MFIPTSTIDIDKLITNISINIIVSLIEQRECRVRNPNVLTIKQLLEMIVCIIREVLEPVIIISLYIRSM